MSVRRNLLLGGIGLALAGAVWTILLRPAALRQLRLTQVSAGTPHYASLVWRYGLGARPQSVILDITAGNGASGSATVDGETFNAEIPLSMGFSGPYTLSTTATYRILGVLHNSVELRSGTL